MSATALGKHLAAGRTTENGDLMESFISSYKSFILEYTPDGNDSDEEEDDNISDLDLELNQSLCSGDEGDDGHAAVTAEVEQVLRSVDEVTVDSEFKKDMAKILNFDCRCQQGQEEESQLPVVSCIKKLSPDLVYNTRLNTASLSKENKDMLVLGTILSFIDDSEMTPSSKQVSTKRKRQTTEFTIHNTVVCRAAFCFALGISKTHLLSIHQSYKDHGAVPQRGKCPRRNRDLMAKIQNFDCKCRQGQNENSRLPTTSCFQNLSPDLVYNTRLYTASLSKEDKDMLVFGAVLPSIHDSEMTLSTKRASTKRKRHRTEYTIHNTVVCRVAFCFVLGISKNLLYSIQQSYKDNGAVPRVFARRQRANCNYYKFEDIKRVVNFITKYAEDHATVLPGRHTGHKDMRAELLPSNVTKASVWRLYKCAVAKLGVRVVCRASFLKLWRSLLPQITSNKHLSDENALQF